MKEGFKKGFGECLGSITALAVLFAAALVFNKNSQNKEKTDEQ